MAALIDHGFDSIVRDLIDRAVVRFDWYKPPPIQPNCGRTRGSRQATPAGLTPRIATTVTDAGKELGWRQGHRQGREILGARERLDRGGESRETGHLHSLRAR